MNTELLYTIGVGNTRSHIAANIMQTLLYLFTIDMSKPTRGILIALFIASIVASVDMGLIHYFNSADATVGGGTRHVRNIDDKLRVFRRIMFASYVGSLALLTLLYFAGAGVAPYFMFTGPGSLIIFICVMAAHDYSVNMRYAELKKTDWVFDYNHNPTVRTASKATNVGIKMFDEKNQFVINETAKPMEVDSVFDQLPPGTKMTGNRVKKPEYREIRFNKEFKYSSVNAFKSINLRKESNHDVKMFNHYLKALGSYSTHYLIEDGFVSCLKTTITLNKERVEKYIEENDYVKRFVPAKEAEVAYISMMLKPELAKMSYKRFVSKQTKHVEQYALRQTNVGLFLTEIKEGEEELELDVSYLRQYMSMNFEEYKCTVKASTSDSDEFNSFQDKLEGFQRNKKDGKGPLKTLHRFDVAGEKIYFFKEDLKTLSELDEIVFSKFINRDLKAVTDKHGIEE